MHFTGRTWRPPYEAHSCILQLTSGCTYGKCRFCDLYHQEAFRLTPMEEFEADLREIKAYQPHARRVFLTGGNPFALPFARLEAYIGAIRDHLIKCQSIAMFASIRDIQGKDGRQLRRLRAMGVNGLTIGTESGDDAVLALAGKGYTALDILEQCRKLEEAGIEYYLVYMTGLAGRGQGRRNAENSARLFSRLRPYIISVDSLTLLPDTALYGMAQRGAFQPAGERERIRELQTFIEGLELRVHLLANTSTNFYPVTAFLPKERQKILGVLQEVLDTVDEAEMADYRRGLKGLDIGSQMS